MDSIIHISIAAVGLAMLIDVVLSLENRAAAASRDAAFFESFAVEPQATTSRAGSSVMTTHPVVMVLYTCSQ
jgi:hypothetical protein